MNYTFINNLPKQLRLLKAKWKDLESSMIVNGNNNSSYSWKKKWFIITVVKKQMHVHIIRPGAEIPLVAIIPRGRAVLNPNEKLYGVTQCFLRKLLLHLGLRSITKLLAKINNNVYNSCICGALDHIIMMKCIRNLAFSEWTVCELQRPAYSMVLGTWASKRYFCHNLCSYQWLFLYIMWGKFYKYIVLQSNFL